MKFEPTFLQLGRMKIDIEVFREGLRQIKENNEVTKDGINNIR